MEHRIKKLSRLLNRTDIIIAREMWRTGSVSIDTARLVFIDESVTKATMTRLYVRGFGGGRVYDRVPHGH